MVSLESTSIEKGSTLELGTTVPVSPCVPPAKKLCSFFESGMGNGFLLVLLLCTVDKFCLPVYLSMDWKDIIARKV